MHHSFDDAPARIYINGVKIWCKNGVRHRDNNLPAIIWGSGDYAFYKNGKIYWFINNEEEYYSYDEVKEKFKNNILYLPTFEIDILKDNGIDAI